MNKRCRLAIMLLLPIAWCGPARAGADFDREMEMQRQIDAQKSAAFYRDLTIDTQREEQQYRDLFEWSRRVEQENRTFFEMRQLRQRLEELEKR
jgi:hypothetical protein